MGTPIDVPLGHKDAAYVRSHFDAMEMRVPDAPRRDEIVVAVVVTDSGRPLPRIGGLTGPMRLKARTGYDSAVTHPVCHGRRRPATHDLRWWRRQSHE